MSHVHPHLPGEGDGVRGDLYGVHINGRLLWGRDWRVGFHQSGVFRNDVKFSVMGTALITLVAEQHSCLLYIEVIII